MNEFVSQFLLEARELTEQATTDLLALEQQPAATAHLDGAFRAFHTLKGGAAIMEYTPMERMLHRAEDTLQRLRQGEAHATPEIIDGCLACIGQVIRWLDAIEQTGELPLDAKEAGARIARQLDGAKTHQAEPSRAWVDELLVWARGKIAAGSPPARAAIRYEPAVDVFFRGEDPVSDIAGLPDILAIRITPREAWPALVDMQPFDCNLIIEAVSAAAPDEIEVMLGAGRVGLQIVDIGATLRTIPTGSGALARQLIEAQTHFVQIPRPPEAFAGIVGSAGGVVVNVLRSLGRESDVAGVKASVVRALTEGAIQPFLDTAAAVLGTLEGSSATSAPVSPEGRREPGVGAIRVDVDKVDAIVDLTGELLVVKNALGHLTRLADEGGDIAALAASLRTQTSRLDRHVTDLQRAVLDLRVLPLGRVFSRFPLLVRETAAKLGKQVAFRSEGDDTVADKAVVESLFEPLLHVVRNAIDHGVEPPEVRAAAGKPATADVVMSAWREGEHVVVELTDDGRGVDASTVRRLAVSRGVADAEAAAALSDDEAVELIFAPGFTTAETITELSGRGVGMNAVRSAIERIGGDVRLANSPGKGLTIRFTLPFTVMMTRVMTVEAGGQVFGLPFDAVLETLRVPRSQTKPLGAGQAVVLRDITIPVLNLASALQLDMKRATGDDVMCLVIASVAGQRVGIEIDRPGERLDLMLKPVEGILAGMKAISGTSLLGDGRVLIVLDLGVLFR